MEKIEYIAALNILIPDYKDEIDFKNFKIRKRTNIELQNYYGVDYVKTDKYGNISEVKKVEKSNIVLHWSFMDYIGLNCNYFIEFKDSTPNHDARIILADFLNALRFINPGKVEIPIIFSVDLKQFQYLSTPFIKNENLMEFNTSDVSNIYKLYSKILKIKNNKYRLITERFENALSLNSSYKNAFIDLVSILESIALQNEKDELRYRFSLLITFILNQLGDSVTFKEIRKIYDVRSKLAHTGNDKDFSKDLFYKLHQYTRKITKWYIDNDLDDAVASRLLFERLNIKFE